MSPASRSFVQVMVFSDASHLRQYGEAVWSALAEMEAFYRRAELISDCRRVVLDLAGSRFMHHLDVDWQPPGPRSEAWQSVRGRFSRTVDQQLLASQVQSLLSQEGLTGDPVVVTDQEITPPPRWHYILWDRVGSALVISTAPMDPSFWGIGGPDFVAKIKQRLRAALICAAGPSLGLGRCKNESCYLFREVESVTCLDTMVMMGPEHRLPSLTGLGFDPSPPAPGLEQQLIHQPVGRREGNV